MDKKTLVLLAGLLFLIVNVGALMFYRYTFRAVGVMKVVGVGVYWDPYCTTIVTEINWGVLSPGENTSRLVYIQNEGNFPTALGLETSDWNPSEAGSFIALSWNYTGGTVDPGEAVAINLGISVSPDITGIERFEFLITVSATA